MKFEYVYEQAEKRMEAREPNSQSNISQIEKLKTGKDFDWSEVENLDRLVQRARLHGLHNEAQELLRDPNNTQLGNKVFEKIIGANNLLNVTFLSEGARMARAVGRIRLPVSGGTRLGTGFMVSPRIMMTNNHVIGSQTEARNATIQFDYFTREDGLNGPTIQFRLQPNRFFINDGPLDFSLIAVEPDNEMGDLVSDRGWFPLIGPSGKAIIGERVSIIQHPDGTPQKVTVHDNEVVDIDPNDDFLHYRSDTMGGSSGSPVLNIDWDLVALHHAAIQTRNEGVRISSIVNKLRQIFSQESNSIGMAIDRQLAKKLLEANRPAAVPVNLNQPNNSTAPPVNTTASINPDGSARWTIPITVTVDVGKELRNSNNGERNSGQSSAETPISQPNYDDTTLDDALDSLRNTEGRVYYSQVEDKNSKEAYYPDLTGQSGAQLYKTLSKLLADTHTTTLSYKNARLNHLYPWIDRRDGRSRQLQGIYTNKVFDAFEVIQQEAQNETRREQAIHEHLRLESTQPIDETFLEDLEAAFPFNCEHVVPQSWFNKRKQPKTDLHHLFTCEWGCNSFRSNHAYFDFPQEAIREDCGRSEDGKFEPRRGKGAVARATLYFLLRYPKEVADSSKEMPIERLETLLQWAEDDRIDRWELHRNAEIEKVQGNRNPLIDFPELLRQIDFSIAWA